MAYAPTTTDRSGEILAAGFSRGLDSLLAGQQKGQERRQQRKRTETILAALYPDQKDALAEKGLAELEGMLDAVAVQRTQELLELQRREGGRADQRLAMDQGQVERRAQMFAGEQRAVQAAIAPPAAPGIAAELERLAAPGAGVLRPEARAGAPPAAGTAAERYLQAGGMDPALLDRLLAMEGAGAEGQFVPQLVDLGGGARAVTTSRKSAVPYSGPTGRETYEGAPELSPDGRFFRSGPGGEWKPVPREPTNPLEQARRDARERAIQEVSAQIAEDEQAIARGDRRHGLANLRSREQRLAQNREKLAQLQGEQERRPASAGARAGSSPTSPAAAPPATAGDAPMPPPMGAEEFLSRLRGGI